MEDKKVYRVNIFALICAFWFFLTGWMWVYFINLIFSLPFGILGYFLWKKGKQKDPKSILNRMAMAFLIGGMITSLFALFLYR